MKIKTTAQQLASEQIKIALGRALDNLWMQSLVIRASDNEATQKHRNKLKWFIGRVFEDRAHLTGYEVIRFLRQLCACYPEPKPSLASVRADYKMLTEAEQRRRILVGVK